MPRSRLLKGRHVLFIRHNEASSEEALAQVQRLDPEVEVIYVADEDSTVTPWLSSPISFFRGARSIRGYVESELPEKKIRNSEESSSRQLLSAH